MYAIIADSGKQFKVEEGQILDVDYREVDAGKSITFDRVLCLSGAAGVKIGKPVVAGANVTAEVVGSVFGDKLTIQKYRRRKNYRRKTGHRQVYTKVKISKING